MDKLIFKKEIEEQMKKELNIEVSNEQIEKFYIYLKLLLEWNEKINLTAIKEPSEIIKKHFIESLTILEEIKKDEKVADIGTGAGFPRSANKNNERRDSINISRLIKKKNNIFRRAFERIKN